MANESCTDCRWMGTVSQELALCEFPLVPTPKGWEIAAKPISPLEPFTGCPTWEKRELTREEQIEAAARGMLRWFDGVYPTTKVPAFEAAREALGLAKANEAKLDKSTPWELAPNLPGYKRRLNSDGYSETRPIESLGDLMPPTHAEMESALSEAGWLTSVEGWTHHLIPAYHSVPIAYKLMLSQKAKKLAQPSEAEMRRVVMEAGWEPGKGNNGWWLREEAFRKTLAEAYALVMGEKLPEVQR